jgi:hypothetical protein
MSRQTEERNRQKFAEKMRQKTLAARAKAVEKKAPENATPAAGTEGNKKD